MGLALYRADTRRHTYAHTRISHFTASESDSVMIHVIHFESAASLLQKGCSWEPTVRKKGGGSGKDRIFRAGSSPQSLPSHLPLPQTGTGPKGAVGGAPTVPGSSCSEAPRDPAQSRRMICSHVGFFQTKPKNFFRTETVALVPKSPAAQEHSLP